MRSGLSSPIDLKNTGTTGWKPRLSARLEEPEAFDTVELDNISAGFQATSYLLDLGHKRIGSITGPQHLTNGSDRLQRFNTAMQSRGLDYDEDFVRSGEFREDTAYSVAKPMLESAQRPSALYVANGVMALGVMRAIIDMGLRCPDDISVASTDMIPGIGVLRPRLTRTEHPILEMTNEAFRLLIDRINGTNEKGVRHVVFQPNLVVGDSCVPAADVPA